MTKKQNASKDNPDVQKTVLSTGETVYNVYYDRRVYTLYFTAANELAFDLVGSFWPIITRDGKVIGEEGSPYKGYGHADQIPIKDGETKKRDKYEISIGSTSYEKAVVHHIDIIKDDFDGKEQIDYDMSYWKSDTYAIGADGYPFILPHLQGFTLKEETREAKWVLKEPVEHSEYRTIDDLNNARNKKTPFRSDDDKIE